MGKIAGTITGTQDRDGMLRRALERIIQLYTDKSHFVYELLQNAEDAEATGIRFAQYEDRLEVCHDGKPFTNSNLTGLCDIGRSDKADNLNQIGEFGVGFKSVYGICDTVLLYSDPTHYRRGDVGDAIPFAVKIKDFTTPEDIDEIEIERSYTTKFVFPYVVGEPFSGFDSIEKLNRVLSQKLQNLGVTTLLFMKNLELIEYEINIGDTQIKGEYLLDKKRINDHCVLASALETTGSNNVDADIKDVSYLKFSRAIQGTPRTVDIAFPVVIKNDEYECQKARDPYVSVYFPTETESKLNFIVQGPYRTTPNRSSIPADDRDNCRLARETATLLRASILELKQMGKFNMSFVRVLPLVEDDFDNFDLFLPLYEEVKRLFLNEAVLPSKSGTYIRAANARIARPERFTTLFSDELLSEIYGDHQKYYWIPTYVTENNAQYSSVYDYLTSELNVPIIRPESLRSLLTSNPKFLPAMSTDWLAEFYAVLETVPALFSKSRSDANLLLTADIIRTSTGEFVSPYRRADGYQYIENVFAPTEKTYSVSIHFVDGILYKRCQSFFDNILQIQKPNEYEVFISDIKNRYSTKNEFEDSEHISDITTLLRFLKHPDYQSEVRTVIKDYILVKCYDGLFRNPYSAKIYMPKDQCGADLIAYFKNVTGNACFVNMDFYQTHEVSEKDLCELGVRNSILIGDTQTTGTYETGQKGRQPEWWTTGDFRWKLSLEAISDVLRYISNHPTAKDSIQKSQAILRILFANEAKLCGYLHIGGSSIPSKENEPCELISVLKGRAFYGWNGKWIFTESGELVAPKSISKYDISTSYYGALRSGSTVYELLGFKRTIEDDVETIKQQFTAEQLNILLENEMKMRYGVTLEEIKDKFGTDRPIDNRDEPSYEFPIVRVKNWDTLKKHAAEILCYADPVEYEAVVRKIRVSNHPQETRAYLLNMYRYEGGVYRYACQLCHEASASIEATQLFNDPKTELDPMNLCMCPKCATVYRDLRRNANLMKNFRSDIISLKESEVTEEDHVSILLDNYEVWFTQIHFAEIQELLKLQDAVDSKKSEGKLTSPTDESDDVSGMSVYKKYKGKTFSRKQDGFSGIAEDVDDKNISIRVTNGGKGMNSKKPGDLMIVSLEFIITHPGVYEIT